MDKKIRLLHMAECAGGVDCYLRMLTAHLNPQRFEQLLVCSEAYRKENYPAVSEVITVSEMRNALSVSHDGKAIRQVRKILKEKRPDIVYCHSSKAGGIGRLAALGLGIPVVYNPHGWAFNMQGSRLKRLVYRLIERWLARYTTQIIAISFFEKLSAVACHIARPEKIKVIFNGIDRKQIADCTHDDVRRLRQDLHIPDKAYIIGMVGRIAPQKAPDVFIEAAALVKRQIPNAHFIIVGDGNERGKVETLIEAEGLGDCVTITGWTEKPHQYTALFDQACLLSRWEGFGLVLAEYMALGKPIVATAVDAIPDLVIDGINGLLVPKDDAQRAAEAIIRLHDDKALCERFVEAGRQRVAVLYDVDRVALEHENLFVKILKHI